MKTNNKNTNNKNNEFKTKKALGQCFLSDQGVIKRIVELSKADKETTVVEIGPGAGAMTLPLTKVSKKVICYEIDKDVIPILEEKLLGQNNYEIINQDILKVNPDYVCSLEGKVISVSNLPYYITSPIIEIFLKKMTNVNKALFMVQKEVADRICASVGTKDYNAFSITVQYYANTKKILSVPRTCFKPSPNVDSAVIEIEKYVRDFKANNDKLFELVVQAAFKERRKMLCNNLSNMFNISKDEVCGILDDLEIRTDARAESLTIDNFIALTNELEKIL